MKIIFILLLLLTPALADSIEIVRDDPARVKIVTETIRTVGAIYNECEQIKYNREEQDEQCNKSLQEYDSRIIECEGKLQEIKSKGGTIPNKNQETPL